MVVRHDLNLQDLGKSAEVPEDISPFQLGTRGQYFATAFELVGRLKIRWSEGTWNEWHALFEDGREGWLAEAQGFYMMSFHQEPFAQLPSLSEILEKSSATLVTIGRQLELLKGQTFQIDDCRPVTCVGSEGELPFISPVGRKSTSVDLRGEDSQFASIDYADDETRLYVGKYLEFEKFKFLNLRQLDGW